MKEAVDKLVSDMDPNQHKGVFSTTDMEQTRDTYFLESGDKIRYFFEVEAFDSCGNLVMAKESSLNKMGHALHLLEPAFQAVSYSERVEGVANSLGFKDPAVIQGMYIFKQPR